MIKDYVYTVGKYLPPTSKEDVLKEIEANLYDYLEETYGKKEYTKEEIESAIRQLGHPKKVAEAFMESPRCLIGPMYIDTYWLVVKIVVISIAIAVLITNIMAFSQKFMIGTLSQNVDINVVVPNITNITQKMIIQTLAQIWQSTLSAFGMVTIIFAAVNYHTPGKSEELETNWSLSILEKAPDRNESVKVMDLVIGMFFILLGLVWINQSTPFFALGFSAGGRVVIPALDMTLFKPFIVWINIILSSSLLLNVYLLIKRNWQRATRVLSIALDVAGIIIITGLFLTPNLLDYTSIINETGLTNGDSIIKGIQISINIGLAIYIVITGIDIFGHLKALISKEIK